MKGDGRIRTGKAGEDMAAAYLQKAGYDIVERNYRCPFGEIDIIAKEGNTVVFVEVKSRKSESFGDPQMAVGLLKQRKLSLVSLCYLKDRRIFPCNARFDVVAVKMLPSGDHIELIRNAFDLVSI